MSFWKKLGAAGVVVMMLSAAGVAGAAVNSIRTRGSGSGPVASMTCPGGMSRLGHPFAEDMTVFEFDPAVHISNEYTVDPHGFLVEDIDMGSHAGTHLDAPAHFIEDGRTVDELMADEFIWPVYKIDVREMDLTDGLLEWSDIRTYERKHGKIAKGSLVVLRTGAEEFWGAEEVLVDEDDNAANVDDFFAFENAGFSGAAVQALFDRRNIDGIGSDAYGPDAYSDGFFDATYTALANDGVALVALANLDNVNVSGDVIFASTVALEGGSGFSTDPIACHGRR
ncbi:MAG: cyclase family protein [Acidimicrobiales bacterium]